MDNPRSITVVGAVRNGEKFLDRILNNILQIVSQHFGDQYRIIIYENDSTDRTRELLLAWQTRGQQRVAGSRHQNYATAILPDHLSLILEDGLDRRFPYRTQRLAYIRNRLLKEALSTSSQSNSYLLITDMDDVNGETTDIATTFHNIFDFSDNSIWDVQTIHQRKHYYDIWALRKRGHLESDCWQNYFRDVQSGVDPTAAHQAHIGKYQTPYKLTKGLIPVTSAFGGAAIYKMDRLKAIPITDLPQYVGLTPDHKGEICEHVAFHEALTNQHKFRIFINPLWINRD